MVDLASKRDVPEVCYPDNDNGAGVTPGASWAWSGWTQLTASLAADLILTGLGVYELISATGAPVTELLEIECGTGSAGSEQTIARAGTAIGYTSSASVETKSIIKGEILDVAPTRISAGTRVAVRAAKSGAGATMLLAVKLYGYPANRYAPPLFPPVDDYLNAREVAGGSLALPTLAAMTLTAGTLWVFGSWQTAIASAAAELLVTGIATGGTTSSGGMDIEIGTGAGGAEVTRALVPIVGRTLTPGPGFGFWRIARPLLVHPGERVALRGRGRPGSTTLDLLIQTHELNN